MKSLTFLFILLLLCTEGWLIGSFVLRERNHALLGALALPIAAVSNVLLIFLCTVFGIPLTALLLLIGHIVIIVIALVLRQKCSNLPSHSSPAIPIRRSRPLLIYRCICSVLLTIVFMFSATHALVLHSFSIDSFTNWTMRSRASFEDRAIALDTTEERGVAKPQYPILVHSLQIMANQGGKWSDRAANAITFLLSWTSLLAAFLLMRRLRGLDAALTTLTLVAGIPLIAIHLAQGYGDIHLTTYLILSLLSLALYDETSERRWLVLSGIFTLAALWTKSEGIFFGFLPWAALILIMARRKHTERECLTVIAVTFLIFLPFLLFLHGKGLGFTPHDSDNSLEWHPEGITAFFSALLRFGSLGATWYLAPSALVLLACSPKHPAVQRSAFPFLLWGIAILLMNAMIYLCTPNIAFLINGQSFARQMMPASALLLTALVLMIRWENDVSRSKL